MINLGEGESTDSDPVPLSATSMKLCEYMTEGNHKSEGYIGEGLEFPISKLDINSQVSCYIIKQVVYYSLVICPFMSLSPPN